MKRFQDFTGQLIGSLAWSLWRPWRRDVNIVVDEGMQSRQRFQRLSSEGQQEEVLKSLQAIVCHARNMVPYYRELMHNYPSDFPRTLEEYRLLPPLDKSSLHTQGKDFISTQFDPSQLRRDATGGSTGEPVTVYFSPEDYGWKLSGGRFHQQLLGCPHGSRIGTLYGGELDPTLRPSHVHCLKNWLSNYSPHGCFRLDEPYLLSMHSSFTSFKPNMILAYASAIYQLALTLEKYHIHPTYPGKVILTGAEKLEDYQRAVLERVFGVPVVERYGSRDIGLMAYQLPGNDRSFWVDRCYCLIEPDGALDEHNWAPILVTTLRRQGMPLLRYRIGDIGQFLPSWRPDQTVARLQTIVGRTLEYIHLPGGRKIHSAEFPHLFKDYAIEAYQVIQAPDSSVCVRIVPGSQHNENERQQTQRIIRENLIGISVNFEYVTQLERTTGHAKLRPVISLFHPDKLGG